MARILPYLTRRGTRGEGSAGEPAFNSNGGSRMNRLISTCLAVSAIALIAPNSANAAAIVINDAGTEGSIVFSANDFEGSISLDGTLLQSGLNNLQSRTVSEGTAGA